MWNPCGILWNPYGICGIHVEYVESIWIPWKELWWIPFHSTWIPEEYSMEYLNSMEFPYGMNMETYAKMAGPSAKQIPYGIHGIHMELAWIPPGIRLECGDTVKTSTGGLGSELDPGVTLANAHSKLKVSVSSVDESMSISN